MREYLKLNDYSKIVDLEEKSIVVARFFYCKASCFGVQEQFYFEIDASHYYDCKMTVLKLTEQTFDQELDCYWRWVNNITGDNLLNIRISYGKGSFHEIEESIECDHERKSFMENFNKKL